MHKPHPSRQQVWLLLLVTLGIYVLLPRLSGLQPALTILADAELMLTVLSMVCMSLTFLAAAFTYQMLAHKPLRYGRTVLIAIANMFTNRLLPAGTGSIAMFYLYLRRHRHTFSQAGSVIAVNNVLGTVAHIALLLVIIAVSPTSFGDLNGPNVPVGYVIGVTSLGVAVLASLIVKKSWHRRVATLLQQLQKDLGSYWSKPIRLLAAGVSTALLTLLNVAALWYCLQAVGVSLDYPAAFVVFSVGMLVGTATPTPGGLGGTEAGLFAGLVGYGVAAEPALAAVFLYRLVSYWLPLLIGIVSYVYVSRRSYLFRPSTAAK